MSAILYWVGRLAEADAQVSAARTAGRRSHCRLYRSAVRCKLLSLWRAQPTGAHLDVMASEER